VKYQDKTNELITTLQPPNHQFQALHRPLVGSSPQSRTGEGVGSRVSVDVENDTSIVPLVEASTRHTTGRSNRTATSNLEVQAYLRISFQHNSIV
jgi:Flp pilus assembly protein TadG